MSAKKTCSGPCGLPKDLNEFEKRKGAPDGRRGVCRLCKKLQKKTYPRTENEVECSGCNQKKPSIEFHRSPHNVLGVKSTCKMKLNWNSRNVTCAAVTVITLSH